MTAIKHEPHLREPHVTASKLREPFRAAIDPFRVLRFNEFDFLLSAPALDLLLRGRWRGAHRRRSRSTRAAGETRYALLAVLQRPELNIIRNAGVEHSGSGGQNVHVVFLFRHCFGVWWLNHRDRASSGGLCFARYFGMEANGSHREMLVALLMRLLCLLEKLRRICTVQTACPIKERSLDSLRSLGMTA